MNYLIQTRLGLLNTAVKNLGNYTFATLEVDFATRGIIGDIVKSRIC